MLDVRRLRVLREVARCGSLSAAAVELGYTQPAVSRQIAVLEAEVGVQLLHRLPQGVALTDAGRLLVERTEAMLLTLTRTEEELRATAALEGGTLRMATFATAAASIVPLALVRFRERHPAVELIVTVADPPDSLPQLREGALDLAICNRADASITLRRRRREEPAGLPIELVPLFEDPMYVVLPAHHRLAGEPLVPVRELADEPWMIPMTNVCPDAEVVFAACAEAGIEPRIAFQYDDYAALLGFVVAGVGISVIPDMLARGVHADIAIRPLDPPMCARPVSAAFPAGYRSPAARAMLEILVEMIPEWVAGRLYPAPVTGTVGRP